MYRGGVGEGEARNKCLMTYADRCGQMAQMSLCIVQSGRNHPCSHKPTSLPYCQPASVAQSDARPTGDQEVAGSTPAGSATFFRGDLIMKSLPSADSRRTVVSFWRKKAQNTP